MLLVTGANGQLGRSVIQHLLALAPAEEIAVSVRVPQDAADLAALGISVRHGDFDEPQTLPGAFAGVRRMLLISSTGLPHSVRYQQHRTAIEAAAGAGVSDIVYTSLAVAAPPCISAIHRQTERALAESGVSYTFLRHPLYTENFTTGIYDELELVSATGSGRVATALRDDLAEAAARVLAGAPSANLTFTLTGPSAWSYDELAAEVTGRKGAVVAHRAVEPATLRELLREEQVPEFLVDILTDIQTTIAAGELADVTGDLEHLLGRPPRPFTAAL